MRGLAGGSGAPSSQRLFGTPWRTSGVGTRSKPRLAHFRTRGMTGTPILPVGSGHSGGGIAAGGAGASLWGGLLDTPTLIYALPRPPAAPPGPPPPPPGGPPPSLPLNTDTRFSGVTQGPE